MTGAEAPPEPDAAWVVLDTPLSPVELAAFCGDLERLYRINPFLEFASWRQEAPDRFRAEVHNHSNGQRTVLEATVTRTGDHAIRVDYARGLKACTRFEIGPAPAGSRLTITEAYGPVPGDTPSPGPEVDRSLHAWGVALKAYLERDRRWGWMPLFRPWMERVWLPMKPSARRITFLVLVIGLADVLLIALGFAIWWLEAMR
ncbi:hypothetical protein BURK1_01169 [Burkholderiales bacterium]|nr:hypothetical protein BURK1_01169 [Burkholderiales bacterium]